MLFKKKKKKINSNHCLSNPLKICGGLMFGIRCLLLEGTPLIHPVGMGKNIEVCLSQRLIAQPSWQVLPHGLDFI